MELLAECIRLVRKFAAPGSQRLQGARRRFPFARKIRLRDDAIEEEARVTLMAIPSKETVKVKNLFNVSDVCVGVVVSVFVFVPVFGAPIQRWGFPCSGSVLCPTDSRLCLCACFRSTDLRKSAAWT